MKWIRLPGVIGFVVVSALITVFLLFAMGPIIKTTIEVVGSDLVGAKVEVEEADFSIAPLGVTLHHVSVADAEQPMRNLFEFDQASAKLQLGPLIVGKGIVDTLDVERLAFHTERKESGALEKKSAQQDAKDEEADGKKEEPSSLGSSLPTAEELLARQQLKTDAAGKATQQAFETNKAKVDAALKNLPDDAELKQYEQEVKALTSGKIESLADFQERKKKLDALKKQFKQDKKAIQQARDAINTARTEVGGALAALKKAPGEDLAALRSQYQLNETGAANVTALLFGDKVGNWAKQALYWYEKIRPYLNSGDDSTEEGEAAEESEHQRGQGAFVNFPTDDPWPDFLIRDLRISAPLTTGGAMRIVGHDITHQQSVLQRPTRITMTGEALQGVDSLKLDATLDHRKAPGNDTLTLNLKGYQLNDLNLGVGGSELDTAKVNMDGFATVTGDQLRAQADAAVSAAKFSSDGQTVFAKELGGALAKISEFEIKAKAKGNLYAPGVSISSDLDGRLKQAMNDRLKERQGELEAKLKQQLQAKVSGYLGDYGDDLAQWNQTEGSLENRLGQLEELGKKEVADFRKQQEEKAKKKVEDKLRSLF